MKAILTLSTLLFLSLPYSLWASERFGFAKIYETNMVLQQKREIKVWGNAKPGSTVHVTLKADAKTRTISSSAHPTTITYDQGPEDDISPIKQSIITDDRGVWSTTFPPRKASYRPLSITLSNGQGESSSIHNLLIGEVWVCSGQSNMAWSGSEQSDLYQNSIPLHGIRFTSYNFTWPRPLKDLPSRIRWEELNPESFGGFSKVPYFFARALHLNLGVPIGVIINARGGTLGISWTSWEELDSIKAPEVKKTVSEYRAKLREWESPQALDRLVKAKKDVINIWRPKAQKAIDAHWQKYDRFIKEHLDDEKNAIWKQRFSKWQEAIDLPKNSPGVLHNWKVWGLERQCQDLFTGTDLTPPKMDMSLWKERPKDTDPRLGWSPPAGLFNAGTAPLKSLALAGIIFYQGENQNFGNISNLTGYRHIFPKIISAHRKLFNQPDLPFGIISLAGWGKKNAPLEQSMFGRYPYIMEIHAKTHENTPNTGLSVIHDLGDSDIHPPDKRSVGERIARWALGDVYEKSIVYRPDFIFSSMEIKEGKASLSFTGNEEKEANTKIIYTEWKAKRRKAPRVKDVLPNTLDGGDYLGFTIAGDDRRWFPAQAKANLKERVIEVWSDLVPEPVAIRYGWEQFSHGNLGSRAAPHPLFRSDDWPCPEVDPKLRKKAIAEALLRREVLSHADGLIRRLGDEEKTLLTELKKLQRE